MALRPYIIDLQQEVLCDLALDAEVVLRRVLRAQMRLEVAVHEDGEVIRPTWILSLGCLRQKSVESIRGHVSSLPHKWSIEESVEETGAAAKGWFSAELLQHQLLHRVVEESPAGADAGLAVAAKQLAQKPAGEVGTVRETDARRERFVVS